jgi:hypothetical protein
MNDVRPFPVLAAICNNTQAVAAELRELANRIEAGDYSTVRGTVTVLDTDVGVYRYSAGPADGFSRMEVAGLLTYAIHHLVNH